MVPSNVMQFTGGLGFKILRRLGVDDARIRRIRTALILLLPLVAWLPLLVLSGIAGKLAPGSTGMPFLLDLAAHIRLLVALPLFLIGARAAEARMIPTLQQFLSRRLIPEGATDRYNAAIASAFRLGDSLIADLCIIGLIYALDTFFVWRALVHPQSATWQTLSGAGSAVTLAGLYYAYVSLPIFQFILFRWYFRLFVWARFLWQVARIGVRLVPTNPDRLGGLGFLIVGTQGFTIFAMAHGALLAGWVATRVVVRGEPLQGFKDEAIALVIWVLLITIGPLLVFTPHLILAKRRGLLQYGALATRYTREFDDKWINGQAQPDEPLVGSSDIQSLADMGGSYDRVVSMRSAPITPQLIISLVIATLLPVFPILLTKMPISVILKKLAGVMF